jgi:hypothetical protein
MDGQGGVGTPVLNLHGTKTASVFATPSPLKEPSAGSTLKIRKLFKCKLFRRIFKVESIMPLWSRVDDQTIPAEGSPGELSHMQA